MPPPYDPRISAIEQRLQALYMQLRGSPGVSTAGGGALSIRTLQLGFAAELTGSYDATTGYPWKRLKLDPPAFVDPDVQLEGVNAFEISGDESLVSGTSVWMEPSPDAVGYIFTVSAATNSSACSGFMSSIRSGRCYRLTIDEAGDGSCSCVPTGQSANLTWNSVRNALTSDQLLYGCPPGIVTTLCPPPTGAPKKWNLPVSGFTGGSTNFNQNYTITHTTGETWAATKNGVTVTSVQTSSGNWTLTLNDGVTTVTYTATGVANCCSAITFNLSDGGGSSSPPATLTLSPASACGKGPAYTPILDKCTTECMRNARLRCEPVAGSGARTILFDPPVCGTDASGNKYADFSTDDPLLCTGTEASGCGDNKFTVRVTCVKCPKCACTAGIAWNGAGWYCVSDVGCVYYDTDPGGSVVLCSGPYETEAGCEETIRFECDCPGESYVPQSMCMSVSLVSGVDCLCLDGAKRTVTYDPASDKWTNSGESDACSALAGPDGNEHWTNLNWGVQKGGTAECPTLSAVISAHKPGSVEGCSLVGVLNATGNIGDGGYGDVTCVLSDGKSVYCNAAGFGCTWGGYGPCGGESKADQPVYKITVAPSSADCDTTPTPVTYKCVNGVCTAVYDGSGTSLAACLAACAGGGPVDCDACGLSGQTATLVCGFGTFTAPWGGPGTGFYNVVFTDGSFVGSIRVDCVTGLPLVLTRYDGSGNQLCAVNATSATCGPPAIFTFDGTCTGGGTATVTT